MYAAACEVIWIAKARVHPQCDVWKSCGELLDQLAVIAGALNRIQIGQVQLLKRPLINQRVGELQRVAVRAQRCLQRTVLRAQALAGLYRVPVEQVDDRNKDQGV